MTASAARVLVLADDRAGHANQALGVAEALGAPFSALRLRYNRLARLPNALLGATARHAAADSRPAPPWPDLVIAAGRRTAPVARAVKARSGGRTRLVQCMRPGPGAAEFDLIAAPAHDDPPARANLLRTVAAPHRVTRARLAAAAAEWRGALESVPRPRLALLAGGATRRRPFGAADAEALAARVRRFAAALGGGVLLATSRRTGPAAAERLAAALAPGHAFLWHGGGENPYLGYLALADVIVAAGDSTAMCAEACATGRPVYIDAPPARTAPKHARLHRALYDLGATRPLGAAHDSAWRPAAFDDAALIARAVRERGLL